MFKLGGILKRALGCVAIFFLFSLFLSCASTSRETKENREALTFTDISDGLPHDGLWRQNIALADMDGSGFLNIVAPPPRKAEKGQTRPFIFSWSPKEGKWAEGSFRFPEGSGYSYAGIAVGDINRDGAPDIVLATHTGKIIVLLNDGKGGFSESPFPAVKDFSSRTVEIADINGDGWPDVIAFSEGSFDDRYIPKGILVGSNKEGKDWDVKILEGGTGIFGDSMAIGDLRGNGIKDIITAPITMIEEFKKFIWLGDGKGKFEFYDAKLAGDKVTQVVRAGDVDGDGKDVVVFRLSGSDSKGTIRVALAAYKWTGEGFSNMSGGLEAIDYPYMFDLADLYGDGKKELVVLSEGGIDIYRHGTEKWVKIGSLSLSPADTRGAYSLRAARNKDGSLLIVFNLGREDPVFKKGIRAYRVTLNGGK
jgi:hypothetical protein